MKGKEYKSMDDTSAVSLKEGDDRDEQPQQSRSSASVTKRTGGGDALSTLQSRSEGAPLLRNSADTAVVGTAVAMRQEDDLYGDDIDGPTKPTTGDDFSPTENSSMIEDAARPVYYRAIFTTISVFMGYSGMIVLQDKLKTRLGIVTGSDEAYVFGVAVSFLYLGNLIFRLMHNILFSFLKPRQRVMISYGSMTFAMLTLVIPYFLFDFKHLVFVFIAYLVSGVGIGTFESNLISSLTPLGHQTKSWAVIGIPVGFNFISIGSFLLFWIFPESVGLQAGVYFFIGAMNLCGLLIYIFFIPDVEFEGTTTTIRVFYEDMKKFKDWLPTVWRHCFALMIDMFCVSIFSSIALYIFDVSEVPLWPRSETQVPKNAFAMVYYTFSFCGDFFSRRIAYRDRLRNPIFFLALSIIGAGLVLSKTALVAPLGMFCVMFANGSVYAQTTKFVDIYVDKQYNLMALSMWLFIGDVGSFVGAQITQPLRTAIGGVPMPYNTTNATGGLNSSMWLSSDSHGGLYGPPMLQAFERFGV
jgi:hypothetical protein